MIMAMKAKSIERSKQRSKSVPRVGSAEPKERSGSGRIRQARQQLPIRRPERIDLEEINKSVAAKLQPLEQVTQSILASVEERKGGGAPLLKATCKDFVVGRASCAASSVVTLFLDRIEYKFSHATQGRIDMVMYVKDLLTPVLDAKSQAFKFRVGKPLRHFIDSYDCTDPAHSLVITFHEKADMEQFKEALSSSCKVALQMVQ
ncbi:hypothetical protein GPECTOR_32g415 [Gonium pectorale]|uniref:Uncharacterized protein n=1 Tax=Gonium pectorale TaxID=33097 RepID=A0A150GDF1_GONPE|nr:hypothetical protein GPECTOR_32g415 [Gonium pectorale]|eukprot:KXZ47803.1 hypothetical protein GPECTOR_32g415 [Gonium pectorale]